LHRGYPKKKKKKPSAICTKAFYGGKKWKRGHILRIKSHMSPYVDNEFLLVARTSQDSKKNKIYFPQTLNLKS
jgi:hypothetical protein